MKREGLAGQVVNRPGGLWLVAWIARCLGGGPGRGQ
jgi:hypothetical protein